MAFDRTLDYSIEQAVALLAGKISLQALSSKSKPVQRYCANMFSSTDFWDNSAVKRYYRQIIGDLKQGQLRALDSQVQIKVLTANGQPRTEAIPQDELSDDAELSEQTRIEKTELRHWIASHHEAHSFLMNHVEMAVARCDGWDAGKLAFLTAEGFDTDADPSAPVQNAATAAASPPSNSNTSLKTISDPGRIKDIQALLDGTHPCQSEELRIALQAWLEISDRYRHKNQNENPSDELKSWVSEHLSNANDYQIIRVSGVANWKHNAPQLHLVQ